MYYRIRLTGKKATGVGTTRSHAVFTLTPRYTREEAQRAMARMELANPSSSCHREVVNSHGQVVTV